MEVNGKTKVLGLLGWPVSHTQSPKIHNTLAEAYDQNVVYVPLPVHPNHIKEAIDGLGALGYLGVNVTVPHKQAVMACVDHVDPAAEAIGAVNTILFQYDQTNPDQKPKTFGYNTDWIGFSDDLEQYGVELNGRDAIVLGAGGSARAVVYSLLQANAKVHILARRPEQADALRVEMHTHFPDHALASYDIGLLADVNDQAETPLIINTTPVGMTPKIDQSPWPENIPLKNGSIIYDLIYTPAETKLMQEARSVGCEAFNGLGMLIGQGAEAFRIWTGVKPDYSVIADVL